MRAFGQRLAERTVKAPTFAPMSKTVSGGAIRFRSYWATSACSQSGIIVGQIKSPAVWQRGLPIPVWENQIVPGHTPGRLEPTNSTQERTSIVNVPLEASPPFASPFATA